MAMNKRKKTTVVVAGVTAVALLLGGTFAWTSISQQAKNEAIVDINPGGRLHDDFNGTNKDVYVENFGDTTTGVDIYARIRLDQYFEVGQDAGKNKTTAMADRNVEALIGTDINDVETWKTFIPVVDENGNIDFTKLQANNNWQWTLGNGENNKPIYMPTFNMNKDSLAADINGTYEGTTEGDIVHYDDYKTYTEGQTVPGTEIYDWDSDTKDEPDDSEYDNGGITYVDTTPIDDADVYHKNQDADGNDIIHTAQQIDYTATVYTMAEWIALGSPVGPYWVYDTDGWAYWAQPIAPGETTGLLLDSINMSKVPDDNYYYGINVVGQFATEGDIYQFDDMSAEAEILFGKVTNTEEIVISGADVILLGNTATYSATRMALGSALDEQPTFAWTATAADGTAIDGVTMTDGTLTVGADVALGTQITVTATVTDDTATLAEDDEAATNTVAGSKIVTVASTATVTSTNSLTMYTVGGTTTETFTAAMDDTSIAGTFTWSVTDGNGNKPTDTAITADTTDSTKATLTVGATESAEKLIVTATFKPTEGTAVYVGTYEIKNSDITTTDDMAATPYAVFTVNGQDADGNDTYAMSLVRSADEIVANSNTYNGRMIVGSYANIGASFSGYNSPWGGYPESVTSVEIVNTQQPKYTVAWFADMQQITHIDGLEKLQTSSLCSTANMFDGCQMLKELDVSKWDVSNVTDMYAMFADCYVLEELDVSKWDVSKVTGMSHAFRDCHSLKKLDVSDWNVSNIESWYCTFMRCYALEEFDVSKWDVSKVEYMDAMFNDCNSLKELDVSKWDVSNVTSMQTMFQQCGTNLALDVSNWNVSNVTNMYGMFAYSTITADCSNWNVANVTNYEFFNNNATGVTPPTWPETTE